MCLLKIETQVRFPEGAGFILAAVHFIMANTVRLCLNSETQVRFPAGAGFFQATVHFIIVNTFTLWLELGLGQV